MTTGAQPGSWRASLVLVVGVDPDGMFRLACGHRKDVSKANFRPKRTQCRVCFPDAPIPTRWPMSKGTKT